MYAAHRAGLRTARRLVFGLLREDGDDMSSPRQIEANRRNAQKSTGPRTEEGKDRSRFNAVKHGMTSTFDVLPGEDAEAFQRRMDDWMADLKPRDALERELVERAVRASWELERAEQAHVDRLTANILKATSGANEAINDDVLHLGERLFEDAPRAYPPPPDDAVGPYLPARIVLRLESSAPGCVWLLDRWAELRAVLEHDGQAWQPADKFKAIRLLGHQLIDALDDRQIETVFLACHAIDSGGGELFREIYDQLCDGDVTFARARLAHQAVHSLCPRDQAGAREALFEIVDRAKARLEGMLAAHRRKAEINAATAIHRLAFDDTAEGERLRGFELSRTRKLLRSIETFLKIRKARVAGERSTAKPEAGSGSVIAPGAENEFKENEPNSSPVRTTRTVESSRGAAGFAANEPNFVATEPVPIETISPLEQEMSQNEPNFAATTSAEVASVSPGGPAITSDAFTMSGVADQSGINPDRHRANGLSPRAREPRSRPREEYRRVPRGHPLRPHHRPRSRGRTRGEFECRRPCHARESMARARDPCRVMASGT
jgi:hypothetical protein